MSLYHYFAMFKNNVLMSINLTQILIQNGNIFLKVCTPKWEIGMLSNYVEKSQAFLGGNWFLNGVYWEQKILRQKASIFMKQNEYFNSSWINPTVPSQFSKQTRERWHVNVSTHFRMLDFYDSSHLPFFGTRLRLRTIWRKDIMSAPNMRRWRRGQLHFSWRIWRA